MKYSHLRRPVFGLILFAVSVGALLSSGCLPIGPIGLIPGGRLRGDVYQGPEPDWREFASTRIVELQVDPEAPRSIHVGFFVHEGRPFVSATLRPSEKRWPRAIARDPHVVLRIEETLYPRFARRVVDRTLVAALLEAGREKFDPSYFEAGRTWFFELSRPVSRQ